MYQIALQSAYHDPLTGLNNRTSMGKYLPPEIDLAKRHSQSMALLMMDLDGFKQINDQCGHDVGDNVLREVGQVISHVVRNTDLVYRYGGDEFVGGLAQTDLHGAIDVCERIRASNNELDLKDYGVNRKVQVSIGITRVRTATGPREWSGCSERYRGAKVSPVCILPSRQKLVPIAYPEIYKRCRC